jgi:MFS family permease
LLLGLVAGPVADHGDRRRLIIGGNLAQGALVATIPLAHLFHHLTIAHIYTVAVLSAVAWVFADAAVFGAVPAIVGPQRLAAANGVLSSLQSVSDIAGPVCAGLLVASVGAVNAVWADAASFIFAAAVLVRIGGDFRTSPRSVASPTVRATIRRATRYVRDHRVVTTLLVAGFGNSFGFGIIIGLLVPYAVEHLSIEVGDGRIAFLFGALGVGSLVAGLSLARVFRPRRVRVITPASLAASALLAAMLAASHSYGTTLIVIALFSCSITLTIMIGITYRQLVVPDELRSSVNVMGRMIAWGGQPFGAVCGAPIASFSTVVAAYGVAAVVMAISALGAEAALRHRAALAELAEAC